MIFFLRRSELINIIYHCFCQLKSHSVLAITIAEAMDLTVDPCTDFYQFACGGWMAKNSIPEGKAKWGRFYELRDKVDQALHGNDLQHALYITSCKMKYSS